jgi:outer membrane protein
MRLTYKRNFKNGNTLRKTWKLIPIILFFPSILLAQQNEKDTLQRDTLHAADLAECVQYALKHQAIIRESLIDEKITEETIKTKLADWYPQLNLNANFQDNFQLTTAYFSGNYVVSGTNYISGVGVSASQNIFNRDLLLASKTATDVRKNIRQITDSNRISIASEVSKAFYSVLLTQKQTDVLDEDIVRLNRSLKDAYNQYQGGIVDKTDYKRATISLNNAKAQRKQMQDQLTANYYFLKQLMGYPDSANLELQYDSTKLEANAYIDTLQQINYDNRIEYKLLQTQKRLQEFNLKYYKWGFLPTVSAFGTYNLNYLTNQFSKLYNESFPNSYVGLQLAFPIFQGFKRVHQVKSAQLQINRIDYEFIGLKSYITSQYAQALASYKGNLANYLALKDNVQLANDVYNVVRLQYQQGIKTYLDVIVAESDLRTSQLNYYTSLYQLLQSKIDVQKALGTIQY